MSSEDSNTVKNAEIKDKKDDESFLKKKNKPNNKNIIKNEDSEHQNSSAKAHKKRTPYVRRSSLYGFTHIARKSSPKAQKKADSDSDSDEDFPLRFRRSSLKEALPSSANGRKRPTPATTTAPNKMSKRTLVDQDDVNVVVSLPPGGSGGVIPSSLPIGTGPLAETTIPDAPIPDIPDYFLSYVTRVVMTAQKGKEGEEKEAGKPKAGGSLFSHKDPTGEALKILEPYIQDYVAQYRKTDVWDQLNELKRTAFQRFVENFAFIRDVKDLHKRSCLRLKKACGDIKAQTDELAKLKAEMAGLVSERDAAVSAKVEAEAKVSELNEVVRIERQKWAEDKLVAQRKGFEEKDKAFRDSLLLANSTAREAYKLAEDGKPYTDPFPKPSGLCQDLS